MPGNVIDAWFVARKLLTKLTFFNAPDANQTIFGTAGQPIATRTKLQNGYITFVALKWFVIVKVGACGIFFGSLKLGTASRLSVSNSYKSCLLNQRTVSITPVMWMTAAAAVVIISTTTWVFD